MEFILIGLVVILIIFILFYKKSYNYFTSKINIDCVIARFNESVSWIKKSEFGNVSRFFIYNKGTPIKTPLPKNAIEIMVDNVGKCDHTYLHHIINNYDNLGDITLFVSGRADDSRKGPKILETMRLVNKTGNSVFIGFNMKIPDDQRNFTLSNWLSSNPENQIGEGTITRLVPAKIRPFGKWFNYYWPGKKINLFTFQSIFAVHRNHIIQHPIDYYKQFYEEVNYDVNPEAGHYIERAWGMIFSPFPKNCVYYQ